MIYISKINHIILFWASIGVLVAVFFGFLGESWWAFDILSNFYFQYFIFSVGLLMASMFFLDIRFITTASLAVLITGISVFSVYLPSTHINAGDTEMRITWINMLASNTQHEKIASEIRRMEADVVFMTEVTRSSFDSIGELIPEYTYKYIEENGGVFNVALYSKEYPFEIKTLAMSTRPLGTVMARYLVNDKEITIIGTHPAPPVGPAYTAERDEHMINLATHISSEKGALVLVGDFNTTPWSFLFRKIMRISGLRDTRQGFGLHTTWFDGRYPFLRIPIDHMLVSHEVDVLEREVGMSIGSDHFPVHVVIAF